MSNDIKTPLNVVINENAPKLTVIDTEETKKAGLQAPRDNITMFQIACNILSFAWKPMIGGIFHPAYLVVNSTFLGHSEKTYMLSGFGLGSLTMGIIMIAPGMGLSDAVFTLISQEYGAGNKRMCWVYMNRQLLINTGSWLILMIPLLFINQIYAALGQDPEIISYAVQFCQLTMFFSYLFFQSQVHTVFAMSQKVSHYAMISNFLATIVHLFFCWLLFIKLDWGFAGICWATNANFTVRFICNFCLVRMNPNWEKFDDVHFFSEETYSNLGPHVIMCLKQAIMQVWGYWAFDIFTLMASYMSIEELAAQTAIRSLGLLTFMIATAISTGAVVFIGNNVGAENKHLAQQYYKTCFIMIATVSLVINVSLGIWRDEVIAFFTQLDLVAEFMAQAWALFQLFTFFDSMQSVGASAIRATGKQGQAAVITICAYWALGIPGGYLFAYTLDLGLRGLWLGGLMAVFFIMICYNFIFACIDWPILFQENAKRRAKELELKAERNETHKLNQIEQTAKIDDNFAVSK